MSKKFITLLIGSFTILFLILIAFYTKTTKTAPKKTLITTPIQTPAPSIPDESILYFSPDTITSNRGQENEVNIQINSQGKLPTLLQLELAYDPSTLSQITLFPGDIYPNPDILLNENDEKTGRISFAFSLPSGENPKSASGSAARMKFKINKDSPQNQTTIYFLPKTSILSSGATIPLKIAYGLKILINSVSIKMIPTSTTTNTNPAIQP